MQQANEFICPRWIGEAVHPRTQAPTGVHLFGLVVDPAGYMVAGIFGARPTRMARFTPEIHLGIPQAALLGPKFVTFKPAVAGSYEMFEFKHGDGLGQLALYIDKTAMLTHNVEFTQEHIRFFAIGSAHTNAPFYALWARRLQELLSIAILPEWYPRLWQEMADQAWIAPCENYGGFGPAWDVFLSRTEALDQLLSLIKTKQLQ